MRAKLKRIHLLTAIAITLVAVFVFSACSQVSALRTYNGPKKKYTDKCFVVRTALVQKFNETIEEYKKFIQGDSHVETGGSYENEEAAYDCMAVGAKSALVLERGVVATSTVHVSGSTSAYYNPTSNQYYITSTPGYNVSTSTSGYIVVFFKKKISGFGAEITWDDYKAWKKSNFIKSCSGCD